MTANVCHGAGCTRPATLRCPKCIALGISIASHFCSQACFKENWVMHKSIHPAAEIVNSGGSYDPFPGMIYTGSLRAAYPLTPTRHVPKEIMRPDYAEDGLPKSEMKVAKSTIISVLNAEEIQLMRNVCRIGREVLDAGARAIRPGVTTDEIDRVVHEATIARGGYPSPLNYHRFPKSCCTSVNEVICHGIPDRRPLESGDIINIDVSVYKDGFHADLNETYCVGEVDDKSRELIRVTRECLEKAIALVKPGALYRDLGAVIEKHAKAHGFSVVRSYCGHGINRLFHGAPNVPHYAKNKAIGVMKPGHTFTIEPMISEGTYRDEMWLDNWTAVTADGKRSAQFEHTLLVTETGCDILYGFFREGVS